MSKTFAEIFLEQEFDLEGNPKELNFEEEIGIERSFKEFYQDEMDGQELYKVFGDWELEEHTIDDPALYAAEDDLKKKLQNELDPDGEDDEEEPSISGDSEEELEEKERTKADRMKSRARKDALNKFTKGKFATFTLDQKAQFIAKHEIKFLGPKKAKVVRRAKPKNPADVKKQLKKKAKVLKRTLKSKGAAIRAKALRKRGR